MPLSVEATYENGTLKLAEPLPLQQNERVHVTVQRLTDIQAALDAVKRGYGLLGWTGDAEAVDRVALEPEFGIKESP